MTGNPRKCELALEVGWNKARNHTSLYVEWFLFCEIKLFSGECDASAMKEMTFILCSLLSLTWRHLKARNALLRIQIAPPNLNFLTQSTGNAFGRLTKGLQFNLIYSMDLRSVGLSSVTSSLPFLLGKF